MTSDQDRVTKDDQFLKQYQPSDLRVASEFLNTWLPFLSRDLCCNCTLVLSNRIRALNPGDEESEAFHSERELASLSPTHKESQPPEGRDNSDYNSQGSCTTSLGSWRDGANGHCQLVTEACDSQGGCTSSLGSWRKVENVHCEPVMEASTSGLTSENISRNPRSNYRMSWADMAQEDELEEEEERELNKQVVTSSSTVCLVKPSLSRERREKIRFTNVKSKKDFICLERVKGKLVNIVEGLELHCGVFSAAEQKRIVEQVYALEEKGKKGELKGRTYSAPKKWMRGKGRVTLQFGCCYNYATDKNGNPPGILQSEGVDPIPFLFKVIIKRLVRWHVLPSTCVPDSCIVNIYNEGDCIPPHIDNHDFVRPFCTVSFLSECNILFGSNLKILDAGEFSGPYAIPLPVGSVLVLNGNGADVAKHCVPAVPTKRISITFRKMDELKRPIWFVPEPDLQEIEVLPDETKQMTKMVDSPNSESRITRQPFRRDIGILSRFDEKSFGSQSDPRYISRTRQGQQLSRQRF